jgi:hypothetical protein
MERRRTQTVVSRREESSSIVPLVLVLVALVVSAGGYLWYMFGREPMEPIAVATSPGPGPAPAPGPVTAEAPPSTTAAPTTSNPLEAAPRPPAPTVETAQPMPRVEPVAPVPVPPVTVADPAPRPEQKPPPVAATPPPPPTPEPPVPVPSVFRLPPRPLPDVRVVQAQQAIVAGDAARAAGIVAPLAEQGLAGAQTLLGLLHATGSGVPANPARAFELFTKAAAQGDAEGQYHLGLAYRDGLSVRADRVRSLAWFMQGAARGHAEAAAERDRALASFDDTAKVQADSQSRSLPAPMPSGWIADETTGIKVWSPSWYRNGTFRVGVEGKPIDGVDGPVLDGTGKVHLKATLYGRSDRSFEGYFSRGVLLDNRLLNQPALEFELLESDAMRLPIPPIAGGPAGIEQIWRQNKLDSMLVEGCPKTPPRLYVAMAPNFSGIDDEAVKSVALAATQAMAAVCPLDPNGHAVVTLLPTEHREVYERGTLSHTPKLAEVQLYGFSQPASTWSVSVTNHARQVHARAEQEAQQQRQREAREQKQAREVAAAMTRPMPDIRGFKLGLGFEAFKAAIASEAVEWSPKLKPDFKLPEFTAHEQKVTLADGSLLTGVFSSTQNGSQLMTLSLEQRLRDGPDPDAFRQQLYAKYGAPDEELGGASTVSWWLRSKVEDAPKGAVLRARIESDQTKRVGYFRLTLSDFNLARRDEQQAAAARRAAEREAVEKKKSDKPRF